MSAPAAQHAARFAIGQRIVFADDPDLQGALRQAYVARLRPMCLCTQSGTAMYVALVNERYRLKRMPSTGSQHDPACGSFEPPIELSGLGEVAGTAIREDAETGATALKLDFSLAKIGGRAAPAATGVVSDTVRTDGAKLTLHGLLHYLWDEAGLTRWVPAMAGRRSWFVVRRALLEAADNKSAKSVPLASMLFVPESFAVDRRQEIERNRLARLAHIAGPSDGARRLMVLIAEVKEISAGRYGQRVFFKHLPDMPFAMGSDLSRRLVKRFADELALWNADETTHLVAVGTFGIGPTGLAELDELSLVLMTGNWLPAEHAHELQLLHALTHAERRFTKGLRYNMAADRPLASAVLTDSTPAPIAMYIVPGSATDTYRESLGELTQASTFAPWFWRAGVDPLPSLPPIQGFEPTPWTDDAPTPPSSDHRSSH